MKFRNRYSIMTSVALLTGMAVGAVIGALFAPKSGRETRENLAGAIKGVIGASLADYSEVEIEDHLVDDFRAQTKKTADQLTGTPEEAVDLTKTTVKQKGPKSRQLPAES